MNTESERINIPRSQPEEHHRMELVDERDAERWEHEEHQEMSKNEVGSKEAKLGDLAEKFSAWL